MNKGDLFKCNKVIINDPLLAIPFALVPIARPVEMIAISKALMTL